ncbi:hypothetical protein EJB05_43931 [Eragrostis curvula]|uniref:C2H2-type domain-containing protein n=1 Tax=Eragrostis curvula TaxID=38414 RepID=A0A5J9TGF3_9POAL|nr:hypothetical protein EJB05_43931 [Eragrostis curvula]
MYLCPEPTFMHHDPSRELGDLMGMMKHCCRKHGEKKWNFDKYNKHYAVLSDWKAHSKMCGTSKYRCDGTLFSRSRCGGDCPIAKDAAGKETLHVKGVQQGVLARAEPATALSRPRPPLEAAEEPQEEQGQGVPMPKADVHAPRPITSAGGPYGDEEALMLLARREEVELRQNLQLHRRGHDLPWKLLKNHKENRGKVYLCPEPTFMHHDPSRALGDLMGMKKHYCRKDGEKKWNLDKYNKRYVAVSDWKAQSKMCGTSKYRCDGTLFSSVLDLTVLFPLYSSKTQMRPPQLPSLQQQNSAATDPHAAAAALKKKRNQPGNPDPDVEVIALSLRMLLATNLFMCKVCNKGFRHEQNLQLHRRGHDLPWKLLKNPKENKGKVYLCPELMFVHHDLSCGLGDLMGMKKHYCRKHGEKKWNFDKYNKRYACFPIGRRTPRCVA